MSTTRWTELTRRCRRKVRVAEAVLVDAMSSSDVLRTGGHCTTRFNAKKLTLFAGLVEVLYAHSVWVGLSVHIWTNRGSCYRQVQGLSVYVHESLEDDDQVDQVVLEMTQKEFVTRLQKAEKLELSLSNRGEVPVLTADELTEIFGDVIQRLVDTFQAVQVQALRTSTSPRAKFEYEMLQHLPELKILVLQRQITGGCYVLFALPLLGEDPQWDPKALLEKGALDSVYIPDGFNGPNFPVTTDGPTIFIGYSMKDGQKTGLDDTLPIVIEWPARLQLSSQVTQTPLSSELISSVELIASCKKMFLQQWRRRKDFIAELRRRVIVLEYDAVDFSQVFFMLQEQLNAQAPLRIIILRLEFAPAFFITNCMSDLQVTMLDGEEGIPPVVVILHASSTSHNSDAVACVAQFLEFTQKSLLQHFYGT